MHHKFLYSVSILYILCQFCYFPDIDECSSGVVTIGGANISSSGDGEAELWCHQVCNNTNGSYECACFNGYTLKEDGKTCEGILCYFAF